MRLPVSLLLVTVLAASGCSDGEKDPQATPSTAPTPTATQAQKDPFEAISPPTSPGVGAFDPILANRAYQATRGFLALQLLEKTTITGTNGKALVAELQGLAEDPTIGRDLGGKPTRNGLDYRPLFPQGTAVAAPVASVTRSVYTADAVTGQAGEEGLRITWSGTLTYPVTFQGKSHSITYGVTTGYIFSRVAQDPTGLELQQLVRGRATVTGVVSACLAKGLLYPGPAAGPCPV